MLLQVRILETPRMSKKHPSENHLFWGLLFGGGVMSHEITLIFFCGERGVG